jgi:hypothetical protein
VRLKLVVASDASPAAVRIRFSRKAAKHGMEPWGSPTRLVACPRSQAPSQKFEFHPGGRFSTSVQVEIPPDTKHYELHTEQFGHAAHAMPLTNPPPGPTGNTRHRPKSPSHQGWRHRELQPNLKLDLRLDWWPIRWQSQNPVHKKFTRLWTEMINERDYKT